MNYALYNHSTKRKDSTFLEKYKNELMIFLVCFITIITSTKLGVAGTNSNVEQWLNLTNQMFYGKQDFLFSYGPLFWLTGHTTFPYSEMTYWFSLTFITLTNSFFWMSIFILINKTRNYLFFIIAFVIFYNNISFYPSYFLWPFALVAYLEFSDGKRKEISNYLIFLTGILVAFSFYVRFFFGLIGFLTIFFYLFSRLIIEKKYSHILYFFLAVVIGYVLIGLRIFHDSSSVITYLRINSQLSFGNSVDMTYDVANTKRSFISVLVSVILLNLFVIGKKKFTLFLTVNIIWILLFKLGFSRTDHYLIYFVVPISVLSLIMLFEKGCFGKILFTLALINLYSLAHFPTFPGATTLSLPLTNKPFDFGESYQDRMVKLYPEFKLKAEILDVIKNSTVDVYPYNNEYTFSNKLNYLHRPSFQNYMTLTPALDGMNKSFFNSPQRPEYIIWTAGIGCISPGCDAFDGFDMKYALNEDPLTSTSILLNYHPVKLSTGKHGIPLMLLQENTGHTEVASTLLSEQEMQFGQWYTVPKKTNGLLKIKPLFEFTALGHLKNTLFRGSVVRIHYKFYNGQEKIYRVNLLNARNGIVISPLLDHFDALGFSGYDVSSFMLETDAADYIKTPFTVQTVMFDIPTIRVAKPQFNLTVVPTPTHPQAMNCQASVDSINQISPSQPAVKVSDTLVVTGWLSLSADHGTLFDSTMLTLTDEKGSTAFFSTQQQLRADVANAFRHDTLEAAGFMSTLDTSVLKGKYQLSLAGKHNGETFTCGNLQIPLIIN